MGLSDFFISKFSTEGKLDTLITYGSVRDDHFSDLVVNHNGIFISGTFLSEVDIDPDQVNEKVLVSNGGQDVFVLARGYPVHEVLATLGLGYLLASAIQHWNAAHFVGRPFQYTTLAERRNVTLCRLHPCLGAEKQRYHGCPRCDSRSNTRNTLERSLGK